MKPSLRNRIEALEQSLRPNPIDWGRIYDALKEIDDLVEKPPGDDSFVARTGTREEFIRMKNNQYQKGDE